MQGGGSRAAQRREKKKAKANGANGDGPAAKRPREGGDTTVNPGAASSAPLVCCSNGLAAPRLMGIVRTSDAGAAPSFAPSGKQFLSKAERRKAKKAATAPPLNAGPPAAVAPSGGSCASCAADESSAEAAGSEADLDGAASRYREWQIPAPTPQDDDGLFEALQIATEQAATIHGRKYRYGALLIAGDDHVPLKSGSNKKIFQRDEIHAEISVLKGCPRPAGKDMFIARLVRRAHTPAAKTRGRPCEPACDYPPCAHLLCQAPTAPPAEDADPTMPKAAAPRRKLLNARPCANCEAKMVRTGIRRCYFTVNASSVGVLEYNPE